MAPTTPKRKSRAGLIIGLIIIVALIGGGVVAVQRLGQPQDQAKALQTAEVTTITAISSVTSSGSVLPKQSSLLYWKATGTVAAVNVKTGDRVKAGDVLMSLDLASVPQNIIQAQAEVIAAQTALDDLLHPSATRIANGQKAVADAQKALETAQKNLKSLQSPDVQYYRDQVKKAQDALTTAKENIVAVDVGALNAARANAQDQLTRATNIYNDAKDEFARCPLCVKVYVNAAGMKMEWKDVVKQYNDAVNNMENITISIAQAERQNSSNVTNAQDKLKDAQDNLAWALSTPNAIDLAQKEAAVAVANANLADALDKLDHLINSPDPNDLATAQARLQATQATADAALLSAPFAGEILAVNYQPGDTASATQGAVGLADRTQLHIDTSIDESDIGSIRMGNPVSVTFSALPDVALAGTINEINPVGVTVQGLVKYTVRVELTETHPSVLLGMTADITIITSAQTGALAVPLDAVQFDAKDKKEFVNRVRVDGTLERVPVVSGQMQDEMVVITGDLQPGDKVELVTPKPAISGMFGPG